MKIVLASDSHSKSEYLKKIALIEKADYYFCLGDSCDDAYAIEPFISVKGNCDFYPYEKELKLKVGGFVFYLTHGHLESELGLFYKAKENEVDIVCTGHTHVPHQYKKENILFLNPGSIARPRGGSNKSYMVLTYNPNCKKEDIQVSIKKFSE